MRFLRNQSGQAMLLVLGFAVLLFAVAGVAIDGARVFILRRGLQHAADAVALAAANELDVDTLYASDGGRTVVDRDRAVGIARSLIEERGFIADLDVQVRGRVVRAVVRSSLETSFLSLVGIEKLPVAAEAAAVPVFGE